MQTICSAKRQTFGQQAIFSASFQGPWPADDSANFQHVPAKDCDPPKFQHSQRNLQDSASQTPILGFASDQNHLTAPTPTCSASRRFSAPASRILGQHTTAPTFSMCKQTISVRQTSGTRLRSANLQDLRPPVNDLQDFRPAEMLGQQTISSASLQDPWPANYSANFQHVQANDFDPPNLRQTTSQRQDPRPPVNDLQDLRPAKKQVLASKRKRQPGGFVLRTNLLHINAQFC